MINTFIGLALGPYLMGQISDFGIAPGMSDAEALQRAMVFGLLMFVVSAAFLLAARAWLVEDETTRVARAQALGEPTGE